MHELSIALSILDVAEEESARRGDALVAAIHLRLGPLSGVVKAALVSAFDLAREGTSLATTNLVIEEVPIVVYCSTCDAERGVVSIQDLRCSICGAAPAKFVSGRELEIFALEVLP